MSALNGDMRADSPDGHGLWIGDARHLSDYRSVAAGLGAERERFVDGAVPGGVTILS